MSQFCQQQFNFYFHILEMLRNITQTFFNEECPFYRPSPFNKFNSSRLPLQSRVQKYNMTLPLQSNIDNLKLNNPFRNNTSVNSILNNSKYNKRNFQVTNHKQNIHYEVKQNYRMEYNTAPNKIQESFVEQKKEFVSQNKRTSLLLLDPNPKQSQSRLFLKQEHFQERLTKSKNQLTLRDNNRVGQGYKNIFTLNLDNSMMKMTQSQTQSKAVIQHPEETITGNGLRYYSTKVKRRRLNF